MSDTTTNSKTLQEAMALLLQAAKYNGAARCKIVEAMRLLQAATIIKK